MDTAKDQKREPKDLYAMDFGDPGPHACIHCHAVGLGDDKYDETKFLIYQYDPANNPYPGPERTIDNWKDTRTAAFQERIVAFGVHHVLPDGTAMNQMAPYYQVMSRKEIQALVKYIRDELTPVYDGTTLVKTKGFRDRGRDRERCQGLHARPCDVERGVPGDALSRAKRREPRELRGQVERLRGRDQPGARAGPARERIGMQCGERIARRLRRARLRSLRRGRREPGERDARVERCFAIHCRTAHHLARRLVCCVQGKTHDARQLRRVERLGAPRQVDCVASSPSR